MAPLQRENFLPLSPFRPVPRKFHLRSQREWCLVKVFCSLDERTIWNARPHRDSIKSLAACESAPLRTGSTGTVTRALMFDGMAADME